MARPSNRDRIIQAAISHAADLGVGHVTLDAVATAAGLTKGGVQYHFGSKRELVSSVVAHIVAAYETEALSHLNRPFEDSGRQERLEAYIRASASVTAGGGELVIFLDGTRDFELSDAWREYQERWTGDPHVSLTDLQRIAVLAADGLWLNGVVSKNPMLPPDRERVVASILRMMNALE